MALNSLPQNGSEPLDPSRATRLDWLLDRLQHEGRIDVLSVAGRLQVAPETIRRDLRALEEDGKLERVHGGAVPLRSTLSPIGNLTGSDAAAEPALAFTRALWDRLPHAGTLLIGVPGASGAAVRLARTIEADPPASDGLTVITRSVDAAIVLSRVPTVAVYNPGGVVSGSQHAQEGDWTLTELRRFRVDVALLWPDGITRAGLSSSRTTTAAVERAEVSIAHRVLVVGTPESVGRTAFVGYARIDQVDEMLLPAAVTDAEVNAIAEAGSTISRL